MSFQIHGGTIFGEIISRSGVHCDLWKLCVFTKMPSPNNKNELQSFLSIMDYLSKISPLTAEVCKPLWNLMSVKSEWTWNNTNQKLYDRAKSLIKIDTSMAFYNEKQQLYLETDMLDVGLRASLLQVMDWLHFQNNDAHCTATNRICK